MSVVKPASSSLARDKELNAKKNPSMTPAEQNIVSHLKLMFPQLSALAIETSVLHPSNRHEPCEERILLNRCIDDLIELRTFKETTQTDTDYIDVDSDDDIEVLRNASHSKTPAPTDHDHPILIDSQEIEWDDDLTYDDVLIINAQSKAAADPVNSPVERNVDVTDGSVGTSVRNGKYNVVVEKTVANQNFAAEAGHSATEKSHNATTTSCNSTVTSTSFGAQVSDKPLSGTCEITVKEVSSAPNIILTPAVQTVQDTLRKTSPKSTIQNEQPLVQRQAHGMAHTSTPQPVKYPLKRMSLNPNAQSKQLASQSVTRTPAAQPAKYHLKKMSPNPTAQRKKLSTQGHPQNMFHTPSAQPAEVSMKNLSPNLTLQNRQLPIQHHAQNMTQIPAVSLVQSPLRKILPQSANQNKQVPANSLLHSNTPSGKIVPDPAKRIAPNTANTDKQILAQRLATTLQDSHLINQLQSPKRQPKTPQAAPVQGQDYSNVLLSFPSTSSQALPLLYSIPKPQGLVQQIAITPVSCQGTSSAIGPGPFLPATTTAQPSTSRQKSPEEVLMEKVTEVVTLIPDVDPAHVKSLLQFQYSSPTAVNDVVLNLLEAGSYPKVCQTSGKTAILTTEKDDECEIDYYKEYSKIPDQEYTRQSCILLQNEFRRISVRDIRAVLAWFKCHYAPARKCIYDGLASVLGNGEDQAEKLDLSMATVNISTIPTIPIKIQIPGGRESTINAKVLKTLRPLQKFPSSMEKNLEKEVQFVVKKAKIEKEAQDHLFAMNLNEHQYEETGQLIECGCCYGEFPFDSMVQCYEGHLFCMECLQRYAQEAVYGSGKAELNCMTSDCDATYPMSQLQKSLPSTVLAKYEDRVKEETINLANLEDLVRCPHCNFAALLDPADKVFKCQDPKCMKETCRHCKEDWSGHFGIPCNELEKKDETKLRLSFEEKMTEAKIRSCHRCKTGFTKSDGCNKMTCRCGAKMCYICRKPDIDYNHFCRHPRDPGKACTKCSDCSLWTNPEEDDERAVQEIRRLAQEERKKMGFEDDKLIGVPDEPVAKKARKH